MNEPETKIGIDVLSELARQTVRTVVVVRDAKSDGRIRFLEALRIGKAGTKVIGAAGDINDVAAEFSDLNAEKVDTLAAIVREELNLPETEDTSQIVDGVLHIVFGVAELSQGIRAARHKSQLGRTG